MKTIFEPFDFERGDAHRLSGAVVRTTKYVDGKVHFGEPWMIGSITVMSTDKEACKKRWMLVSTMDGLCNGPFTAEELCEQLNSAGHERVTVPVSIGKMLEKR